MGPLCGASSLLTSSPFSTFLTFCFTLENSLRLPALPWKFHFSLLSGAESLFLCPPSWPPVPASEPPGPLSWGHWPRPAPISGLHGASEDGTGSLEEQEAGAGGASPAPAARRRGSLLEGARATADAGGSPECWWVLRILCPPRCWPCSLACVLFPAMPQPPAQTVLLTWPL